MDILEGKYLPQDRRSKQFEIAYKALMEFKAAVLGYTALKEAPQLYYDGKMIMNMNYSPTEWKSMPIQDRAVVIATTQLENMVHIIDGYYKEEDRRKEKAKSDAGKKGKKTG